MPHYSLNKIWIHAIWATKNRAPVILRFLHGLQNLMRQ